MGVRSVQPPMMSQLLIVFVRLELRGILVDEKGFEPSAPSLRMRFGTEHEPLPVQRVHFQVPGWPQCSGMVTSGHSNRNKDRNI
jgi:hypothetical protein